MRTEYQLTVQDLLTVMDNRGNDLGSLRKLLHLLIDQIWEADLPEQDGPFDRDVWFEGWKENFIPCLESVGTQIELISRSLVQVAETFYWQQKEVSEHGADPSGKEA